MATKTSLGGARRRELCLQKCRDLVGMLRKLCVVAFCAALMTPDSVVDNLLISTERREASFGDGSRSYCPFAADTKAAVPDPSSTTPDDG